VLFTFNSRVPHKSGGRFLSLSYRSTQLCNRYEWSYNECEAKVLVSSLAEQAPKDVLKRMTQHHDILIQPNHQPELAFSTSLVAIDMARSLHWRN